MPNRERLIIGAIWTAIFLSLGWMFLNWEGWFYTVAGWFFMLMGAGSVVFTLAGDRQVEANELELARRSPSVDVQVKDNTVPTRDRVIGMAASVCEQMLSKEGFQTFAQGYIIIDSAFEGVGWVGSEVTSSFSIKIPVQKIEAFGVLAAAEVEGPISAMAVDNFCLALHRKLMAESDTYQALRSIDPRLAD